MVILASEPDAMLICGWGYFLHFHEMMSVAQRFRRRSDNEIWEGCEYFGKSLLGVHGFGPRHSQAIFFFIFLIFLVKKK